MRVTQQTPDTLVIDEGAGAKLILGAFGTGGGVLFALIGRTNGETLFLIVGAALFLYGLKVLLFNRVRAQRFERWRNTIVIESKGLFGSRRRELRFDGIADIVLEEIRPPGKRPRYYISYLTTQGERITWADSYDGNAEGTLESFRAGREMLGLPPATSASTGADKKTG